MRNRWFKIFKANEEKRLHTMIIKRSDVPVLRVGKAASTLSVTVADNGQVRFSRLASNALGDDIKHIWIDFDPEKRTLKFYGKAPKGASVEDAFTVASNSKTLAAKGIHDYYFSAGALFSHKSIGYDYKASGSQTFPANSRTSGVVEVINLPHKLDAKPKQVRKRKVKAEVMAEPTLVEA